jgi:hypothetical protein
MVEPPSSHLRIQRVQSRNPRGQTDLSKAGTVPDNKATLALSQKQTEVNFEAKDGVD